MISESSIPRTYSIGISDGYDALKDRGRRRKPKTRIHSEDAILPEKGRRELTSHNRDLQRNFEIAAWAIRKHLDFVASFNWQATTDDAGLNEELEAAMREWSKASNFDAAGVHNLARYVRILESRRVIDGDVWALKQNDATVMGIEGDRVAMPTRDSLPGNYDETRFINGVQTDRRGRKVNVCVCNRDGNQLVDPRVLPANFLWHIGYFDRFDQIRGVSPIASAINRMRDSYEGLEFALAKAKVEQLFALVFSRKSSEQLGDITGGTDAEGNEDRSSYSVDFGKGPQVLDLDDGDDAKFLKSESPGSQFESYMQFSIMIALKALDIPYSFFDESHTNFYGSRGGLMQYIKSVEAKRADLKEFLQSWTQWRIAAAIRDGDLDIGTRRIADVSGEWRAVGVPWWDPSKEIDGHLKAIAAGLDNPQRIAQATTGTDLYENIDLMKQAQDYARGRGVSVVWQASNSQGVSTVEESTDE